MRTAYPQIATTARALESAIRTVTGEYLASESGNAEADGAVAANGCIELRRAAVAARGQAPHLHRRLSTDGERASSNLLEFFCLRVEAAMMLQCSGMGDAHRIGEVLATTALALDELAAEAESAARALSRS